MSYSKIKKILIIVLMLFIAGALIKKVGNNTSYSQDTVRSQFNRFVEVFTIVKKFYVEQVESEKLITGAIQGMLSELDPHSVYIPQKNLEKVTEEFEGYFEGIGIEFVINNKILTVISPIVGGPSEAVGILPGDQILEINDKSAYGIEEAQVIKKLRGPKGSKVKVNIRRPGQNERFDVIITRDKIPIYSVIASFILKDGHTGYIKVGRFAKTTSRELEEALQKLESLGMENLILDLRSNSGGLLDQAIEVADKFIPKGYKIVYTRGRMQKNDEDYYSSSITSYEKIPLIVMINHGSASASEIVAGAIQDLDRGLVIGQTSFGKGLVQNQIPLSDGSAMRLTIARYYTPSGRLIQRPYDGGLMDYYSDAFGQDREPTEADTVDRKIYYTLAGRKVYGGGGIRPDTLLDAGKITWFTSRLRTKRVFFEFGSTYTANHTNSFSDFDQFRKKFGITSEMLDHLRQIIEKNEIEFDQESFNKDLSYIKSLMKAEIARHYWDSEHYYMLNAAADPEVQEAIDLVPHSQEICMKYGWCKNRGRN